MFTFIAVVWGLLVLFRLESALRRQQESLDGIERMLKQVAEQPAPSTGLGFQ
jgi:hypothetical protein